MHQIFTTLHKDFELKPDDKITANDRSKNHSAPLNRRARLFVEKDKLLTNAPYLLSKCGHRGVLTASLLRPDKNLVEIQKFLGYLEMHTPFHIKTCFELFSEDHSGIHDDLMNYLKDIDETNALIASFFAMSCTDFLKQFDKQYQLFRQLEDVEKIEDIDAID